MSSDTASTTEGNKRRYSGVPTVRIEAGGDYDEWFEMRTNPTMDDMLTVLRGVGDAGRAHGDGGASLQAADELNISIALAARLITRWSLELDGAPWTISEGNLRALPYEMTLPVIKAAADFLASRSSSTTTSASGLTQSSTVS